MKWHIHRDPRPDGSGPEVHDERGNWIATVMGSHDGHEGFPSDEEGTFNAHLIAAAPDIAEALEEAAQYCPVAVQDRCRAALAKAKGAA